MTGQTAPVRAPERDVRIVGIGASAGGLHALRTLFAHTPDDTGLCFVVVQHLHAEHESQLAALLRSATAMPVHEVQHDEPVRANEIFVITPNVELTVRAGRLACAPRPSEGAHAPIDVFFRSLAADAAHDATGVLLSGSGADGTDGLRAILDGGGATIAQAPASAEFPDMPAHAIGRGVVEVVLPPNDIGDELSRRARHGGPAADASEPMLEIADDEPITDVLRILHETTGIDFSLYRDKTVRRRLAHRAALRQVATVAAYAEVLAREPAEQVALRRALLIGVTHFFRDPDTFDALKQHVFPAITTGRSSTMPIRIWVPGVATGEEAYSILIALHEYLHDTHLDVPVLLFASDVNDEAIRTARAAQYPSDIAEHVSPERLRRFFTRTERGFKISSPLREACVFSRHNLLDDPPFSKLDLISCRNVLIYLDAARRGLIPLFHSALRDPGFLLLGRSEVAQDDSLFAPVDARLSLFLRRAGQTRKSAAVRQGTGHRRLAGTAPSRLQAAAAVPDPLAQAEDLLLSRFAPPSVVVDADLQVLAVRGTAAPFFALPSGRVSHHLVRVMDDTNLFLEVQALVREVTRSGIGASRSQVPYRRDEALATVDLEVTPVGSPDRRVYLVVFTAREQPHAQRPTEPVAGATSPTSGLVAHLTAELAQVRRELILLMEAHESSAEESSQVTADALSDNEELQSLAEELETAKEELQSTNEELLTLNRDLEARHQALIAARDLGRAIVATVQAPLVVVDAEQTVRSVNPAFVKTFAIAANEAEGRALSELGHGAWAGESLRALVTRLLEHDEPFHDVEFTTGALAGPPRTLLMSGRRLEADMGLLTIDDVTQERTLQEALARHQEQRRQAEKMESVGRLAGGIAHDFNNLLTVIMGYCNLLGQALAGDVRLGPMVREIQMSAERAAALTDQLLAFGRRKVLQPRAFDLNALVLDFKKMLARLLDARIDIVVDCAHDLWPVCADSGEIGRVLMNLALNARDAMSVGGTLTLATRNRVVGADDAAANGVGAGAYVELTVADTGVGMDDDTRAHLFEPFFTTKDVSTGSGLGLSTVLGIVQQSKGFLWLDSTPGSGSRFGIVLPRAASDGTAPFEAVPHVEADSPVDEHVILLVDDEPSVRALTRSVLTSSGYVVLEAAGAVEAGRVLREYPGPITLLVCDVLLPDGGGRQVAAAAVAVRPGIKVLFVSGHTEDVLLHEGISQGAPFLQKPFTPRGLVQRVQDVLAAPGL
jgi:two-component system CheB/CheR fusion protein